MTLLLENFYLGLTAILLPINFDYGIIRRDSLAGFFLHVFGRVGSLTAPLGNSDVLYVVVKHFCCVLFIWTEIECFAIVLV